MAYRVYERHDLLGVKRFVRKGATVFDLGANIGYCSAHFATMVGPGGRVFAFEPSPTCLRTLVKIERLDRNHIIKVVPKAISDKCRAALYYETEATISHGFGRIDERPSVSHNVTQEVIVDVTSLDEFCAENEIVRVDFIKLDVEGAELDALHGMERVLASKQPPMLLIEMTGSNGSQNNSINTLLSKHGYRSYRFCPTLKSVNVLSLGSHFHGNIFWITN
jgi:FkbM family methyltransferase